MQLGMVTSTCSLQGRVVLLQGLVYLREELFVKGENGKGKATHLSLLTNCEKCSILACCL